MPIIFVKEISNGIQIIERYHNYPEMLSNEQKIGGILVDSIPEPIEMVGKVANLLRNADSLELYYEYVDRPLTQEEENTQLKQQIQLMQQALDDVILNGGI